MSIFPHLFRTEHSETRTTNAEYGEFIASRLRGKISVGPTLAGIMKYIDSHIKQHLEDLSEAIAIKSISGSYEHRQDLIDMIKWAELWLKKLEFKTECFHLGTHVLDGKRIKLPPILLANYGNQDSNRKTVCIYGFIDVRSPKLDEWHTDPWKLTQVDKKFYGSGTASGKGLLLCWFHVIEAFEKTNTPIPVNIKFLVAPMNRQGSKGLSKFLQTKKLDFFSDIDCIITCEGEWLGEKYPCIIYGTVGHLIYDIFVEQKDGSDIRADMKTIVSNLYDPESETILIPHFNDFVRQITPDEEGVYEAIQDFDIEKIRPSLPPHKQKWDKIKLLMDFWRLPNMHISDDITCTCEKNDKNIIKRRIIVKLVQNQVMDTADSSFRSFVNEIMAQSQMKSKVTCQLVELTRHWAENIRSWHYEAARRAIIQTYKEEPSFIREDSPVNSISTWDGTFEKNILALPLVAHGSNPGESNESISYRNLFEGTKLLAAYLIQLSQVEIVDRPNIY